MRSTVHFAQLSRSTLGGIGLGLAIILTGAVYAQYDSFDQAALAELVNNQIGPIDSVSADVSYRYYTVTDTTRLWAKHLVYRKIGGRQNRELVQVLNRNTPIDYLHPGDTLIFPDRFDRDLRAYSPFPRHYPGGSEIDKLFIIDKTLQSFAAYEFGDLVRWGVVNTGAVDTDTPNGRFNFNWRSEYRVSTLSPPGELWEMYWVFNFNEERGIHTHQYYMPTGTASSHGCVRMMNADAKWVYDWADEWEKRGNQLIKQGTMVLVIGEEQDQLPDFFARGAEPVLRLADLPADPWEVPPGAAQQRMFDRRRTGR
jgi:lipoprotein-anchoring transpeptidase ErfK/SrfK